MRRLVRSLAHLLPEALRTLFGRRVTVRFPFEPLDLPSYYRGKVVIQEELCVGCGACVRDCPAFGLELEREGKGKFRLVLYHDRCTYCGQCQDSCRQGAIELVNEFAEVSEEREKMRQTLVEREGNEGSR